MDCDIIFALIGIAACALGVCIFIVSWRAAPKAPDETPVEPTWPQHWWH